MGASIEPRNPVNKGFENLAAVEIQGNGRRASVCYTEDISIEVLGRIGTRSARKKRGVSHIKPLRLGIKRNLARQLSVEAQDSCRQFSVYDTSSGRWMLYLRIFSTSVVRRIFKRLAA